jgi:hypothetical protein
MCGRGSRNFTPATNLAPLALLRLTFERKSGFIGVALSARQPVLSAQRNQRATNATLVERGYPK